jgi:hypothetical protein
MEMLLQPGQPAGLRKKALVLVGRYKLKSADP